MTRTKKQLNQCDYCGKFKPWSKLKSYGADDGETPVDGLECIDCAPGEFE